MEIDVVDPANFEGLDEGILMRPVYVVDLLVGCFLDYREFLPLVKIHHPIANTVQKESRSQDK